jgi:hypothetical protein
MNDRENADSEDDEPTTPPESGVPLESDPADWQEQQLVVPDPDIDERR